MGTSDHVPSLTEAHWRETMVPSKEFGQSKLSKTKLTPEFGPNVWSFWQATRVLTWGTVVQVGPSMYLVACMDWSPPLMQQCSWENRFADSDQTKRFRPEFACFRNFLLPVNSTIPAAAPCSQEIEALPLVGYRIAI
jgi:hypothetical protein